jgi:hypothetical protein
MCACFRALIILTILAVRDEPSLQSALQPLPLPKTNLYCLCIVYILKEGVI